jgi:hypothetical protein
MNTASMIPTRSVTMAAIIFPERLPHSDAMDALVCCHTGTPHDGLNIEVIYYVHHKNYKNNHKNVATS